MMMMMNPMMMGGGMGGMGCGGMGGISATLRPLRLVAWRGGRGQMAKWQCFNKENGELFCFPY